jgi:hypothetical protein
MIDLEDDTIYAEDEQVEENKDGSKKWNARYVMK